MFKKINFYLGNLIRQIGYTVTPSWKLNECKINLLKLVFPALEARKTTLTIVQIGAFDGLSEDPISEIIAHKQNFLAYLVEPQEKAVKKLREKYKDKSNVFIVNNAIYRQDTKLTMFSPSDEDPKTSIFKNHERRFAMNFNYSFEADAITVKTLLSKYKIEHIDLLQIDTEGYDLEILKMFFEQTKLLGINLEHLHLNQLERQELRNLLSKNNYHYIEYGRDTLAVSDSFF